MAAPLCFFLAQWRHTVHSRFIIDSYASYINIPKTLPMSWCPPHLPVSQNIIFPLLKETNKFSCTGRWVRTWDCTELEILSFRIDALLPVCTTIGFSGRMMQTHRYMSRNWKQGVYYVCFALCYPWYRYLKLKWRWQKHTGEFKNPTLHIQTCGLRMWH